MSSPQSLSSPRHLVFRYAQRLLRSQNATGRPNSGLDPGQEWLHSFDLPGLQTGKHTITVQQNITAGTENRNLQSQQDFNVVGPRFAIPDSAIHSTYPPQGHSDLVTCLPHITFNDPTFPWERVGSYNAAKKPHNPPYTDYDRNKTPWLAVLTFTEDELRLSKAALDPNSGIFTKVQGLPSTGPVQTSTFSINMLVSQVAKIQSATSPVSYDSTTDGTDVTSDMILIPKPLFTSLFSQYDKDGKPILTAPYVYHHRFLAHKRDINSQGMAIAGASGDDDSGSFGVVFSHRSGPFDITAPTAVFVHLVSIEGIEEMNPWPPSNDIQYVAMSSLHSWSYICLPPHTPTVQDEFINLGSTLSLLSPPLPIGNPLFNQPGGATILSRLRSGYSLSRYRLQTGEQTACLIRGPFIPTQQPTPQPWWQSTSMTGTDLQILDQEVGVMDISYSAAWQLGRTMAIADQPFVNALTNVRKYICDHSQDKAQASALRAAGYFKTRKELISTLPETIDVLQGLHRSQKLTQPGSMLRRWYRPSIEPLDLSRHGDTLKQYLTETATHAAMDVASTPDPTDPTQPSSVPYNEFNTPFSVDWVIVLRWILDKLFFNSIPAHYLLTDASQLPLESLRFFSIDKRWTDAMIDGALSLGNHFHQQSDPDRDAIKAAVERYKTTKISTLGYFPPLPKYGCFIRSALITKFPDIIVDVDPAPTNSVPPILLRHEILDNGTMLCLFSEMPSEATWSTLKFTQPPHQQSFSAADHITGLLPQTMSEGNNITTIPPTTIDISWQRAYTCNMTDPPLIDNDWMYALITDTWSMDSSGSSPVYVWTQKDAQTNTTHDVRTLLLDNVSSSYLALLLKRLPPSWFDDNTATSALMAWQLNNRSWRLEIKTDSINLEPVVHQIPIRQSKPTVKPRSELSPRKRLPITDDFMTSELRNSGKFSHPVLQPPPYYPIIKPKPFIPPKPNNPGFDFPTPPKFQYNFYPTTDPATPPNNGQITMGGAPQDILFSIILTSPPYQYQLCAIEIQVPFGPAPTPNTWNPVFTLTNKMPSGAYMLSNLRFNPLPAFSDDSSSLIIRLLPRSTNVWVNVTSCKELTFVLTGVWVNSSTITPYNIVPSIKEYYNYYPTQKPSYTPLMVLKPPKQS